MLRVSHGWPILLRLRTMRVRAIASSLLFAVLLCLCAAIPMWAQQEEEWTWKDRDGNVRSRAELDKILRQHKIWADSNHKFGTRADLAGAHLSDADLPRAVLSFARLTEADLSSGDLSRSDLSNVEFEHTDLSNTDLSYARLSDADLRRAILDHADLSSADMRHVNLGNADLSSADLVDADLRNADLKGADLSEVNLSIANLSGADLSDANLAMVLFEPGELPSAESIAEADNLELMTYDDNPGPLTQIRKQFQDKGYREQERAITYALNRHDADPSRLRATVEEKWKSVRGRPFDKGKIVPLKVFVEGAFKWIAFDLSCGYGLSYGRPLRIVGMLWLLFSIVYAVFMNLRGKSGIYLTGTRRFHGLEYTQGVQIRPRTIPKTKWWKTLFPWLRREWRVLRTAMFFSLMSAFNIGFRDINFGQWLRKLTKREYDLKAVGWARTVSGFQSLLSVYLIALWVLSYFGRPFG